MRVQTGQLEALIWIARLGSFRAAAAQLGLTQPTISMRIRELERVIGATLFDRATHRVALTEKGRTLASYAERIVGLAEQMELQLARGRVQQGPLRLGAADTFALTCLPLLLARMEQLWPELRVQLQVDYSSNLHRRLQRGELDLAFLTGPVAGTTASGATIDVVPLARLALAWVASPRLRLPRARVLRPQDLQLQTILTNPRPSHLYASVVNWFGESELPDRITTCNSLTIIAQLASSAFGLALLPTCILRNEFQLGTLRLLRADPIVAGHDLIMACRSAGSTPVLGTIRAAAMELVKQSHLVQA